MESVGFMALSGYLKITVFYMFNTFSSMNVGFIYLSGFPDYSGFLGLSGFPGFLIFIDFFGFSKKITPFITKYDGAMGIRDNLTKKNGELHGIKIGPINQNYSLD